MASSADIYDLIPDAAPRTKLQEAYFSLAKLLPTYDEAFETCRSNADMIRGYLGGLTPSPQERLRFVAALAFDIWVMRRAAGASESVIEKALVSTDGVTDPAKVVFVKRYNSLVTKLFHEEQALHPEKLQWSETEIAAIGWRALSAVRAMTPKTRARSWHQREQVGLFGRGR